MKPKALCVILLPVVAVGTYCLWPGAAGVEMPASAAQGAVETAALPAVALPAQEIELAVAIQQEAIAAEFKGNGRERLTVIALNKGKAPLRITVPAGQMFETDRDAVVVVRPGEMEVEAGRTCELLLQTAAARSTNRVEDAPYRLSFQNIPKIELYLTHVQDHPELSQKAIQTGILALTENLPLSAVAKFTMAGGTLPSRFNTDPFRVDAFDIVCALESLKALGVEGSAITMTIDPQLKIEAMIDPQTRPVAMRYYQIAPEVEWEFWRSELLGGEPCTRHYALYGIARFYPEVALEMLPRWARETRTNPVYRLSAIQALADTQRPEALPLLHSLVRELGITTALGKAAVGAAEYLDYRLAQLAQAKTSVAFRNERTNGPL